MRNNFKSGKLVKSLSIALLLIIIIILVPNFASLRLQHMLILAVLWAVAGMAWLLTLMVGEFSFMQAGFLAIGAYTATIITLKLGLSFWLALLVAALVSSVFALLIGLIVLRLRGLYFAVITFIVSQVIRLAIIKSTYLGSSRGLWNMPRPGNLGPIDFTTREGWFFLGVFILVITAIVLWRIKNTRIGRIYRQIGLMPDLAQSFGTNLMKYKVQAFVIGGFFTGLTGGVMAHYIRAISPDSFTLSSSMFALMVPVIGGTGYTIAGPIVGALILTFLDSFLAITAGLKVLTYGMLLLLIMIFLPDGVLSLPKRLLKRSEGRHLWRFWKLKI